MNRISVTSLVFVGGLLLVGGCAKQPPQEVTDLNRMWTQTRDDCATVYAEDAVRRLEPEFDTLNGLMAEKKYRKGAKAAETLRPSVKTLRDSASTARAAAKREAENALAGADEALARAATAEADRYAAAKYAEARDRLARARREMDDPCRYYRARDLAGEAGRLALGSADAAAAEKARLEKERLRAEEEARRLAEERRRREKPSDYTIETGNSLWRIAGMEKIYGDPSLWPLLYEANGNLVRNPDLIYPNDRLNVPRGASTEEMRSKARQFHRSRAQEPAE